MRTINREEFSKLLWDSYTKLMRGGIMRSKLHEAAVRICREWLMIVAFNMAIASSVGYFIAWGRSASIGWLQWLLLVAVMVFGVVIAVKSVLAGMDTTEAELRLLGYFLDSFNWKGVKLSDTDKSSEGHSLQHDDNGDD